MAPCRRRRTRDQPPTPKPGRGHPPANKASDPAHLALSQPVRPVAPCDDLVRDVATGSHTLPAQRPRRYTGSPKKPAPVPHRSISRMRLAGARMLAPSCLMATVEAGDDRDFAHWSADSAPCRTNNALPSQPGRQMDQRCSKKFLQCFGQHSPRRRCSKTSLIRLTNARRPQSPLNISKAALPPTAAVVIQSSVQLGAHAGA